MKFKIGDKVKAINGSGGWGYVKLGDVGIVTGVNSPYKYYVDFPNHKAWVASEADLTKAEEQITMDKAKYGVTWMEDKDPTEFFSTLKEAENKIKDLLQDSRVQKDSIYLFELANLKHVEQPILYKLISVSKK